MAEAYIFNGIMLPPVNSLTANGGWEPSPYITIMRTSGTGKYPYMIRLSITKPQANRDAEGVIILSDSDEYSSFGYIEYSEAFPAFVWNPNGFGTGGEIWRSGDEELIWTNYDLYVDGELYMKATAPIEAAYNANAMADSMRRFITQHIYDSLGKREAGALISHYKQKPKTAFAVYSADDSSLTFYNNAAYEGIKAAVDAGEACIYKDKAVTELYVGFEETEYTGDGTLPPPWYGIKDSITRVKFADVIKPTSMAYWFLDMGNITFLDFGNVDGSRLTNLRSMCNRCASLTNINWGGLDTSKVVSMAHMVRETAVYNGYNLHLDELDGSSLEDISNMFYGCSELESPQFINDFDTHNVKKFEWLFRECASFVEVDVAIDASNAESFRGLFAQCTGIKTAKIKTNAPKAKNFWQVFSASTALRAIDLSECIAPCVEELYFFASGCYPLSSVDLSGLAGSKPIITTSMFNDCGELTSLDLSPLNLNNVKTCPEMFSDCKKLARIYVASGTDMTAATDSAGTFTGCDTLRGGNDTLYNSMITDATYARVDASGSPGYFIAAPSGDWVANLFAYPNFGYAPSNLIRQNLNASWSSASVGSTYGYAGNGAKLACVTGNASWGTQYKSSAQIDVVAAVPGHIYYIIAKVAAIYNGENKPDIEAGIAQALSESTVGPEWIKYKATQIATASSGWQRYAFYQTATQEDIDKEGATGTVVAVNLTVYLDSTQNTMQIDDLLVVDLTEEFGAGNEPTLAECNTLFNAYSASKPYCVYTRT